MTIIQRYILAELFKNFVFTFVVLLAIMGMLVFSVLALQVGTSALSVAALCEMVALLCLERLDITLPLAVFTAVIWTYSRAEQDGEIIAMRGAGIRAYFILIPALVLGSLGTLALSWLQDEILPWSHYRRLVIGKRHLAENIQNLLLDDNRQIDDKRFKVSWDRTRKDKEGFVVLENVYVSELVRAEETPRITRARFAKPAINPETGELLLTLQELVRGESIASEEMKVRVNLRRLSEEPPPSRREDDLSYEELLSESRRFAGEPRGLKMASALHSRAAHAFSAFLLALFGAPLGLLFRSTNRTVSFAFGFGLVLVLHYAPTIVGANLGAKGILPPTGAWLGNVLVTAAAAWSLRRVWSK